MNVPMMMASAEPLNNADGPIRCAVVVKPTEAEKHQTEILRYVVVVIALVAVFLLIGIAVYYMHGKSVTIEHASSLASSVVFRT